MLERLAILSHDEGDCWAPPVTTKPPAESTWRGNSWRWAARARSSAEATYRWNACRLRHPRPGHKGALLTALG